MMLMEAIGAMWQRCEQNALDSAIRLLQRDEREVSLTVVRTGNIALRRRMR